MLSKSRRGNWALVNAVVVLRLCFMAVQGRTAYDVAKAGGHRKVMGLLDPVPWLLWDFLEVVATSFFCMEMPSYHSK